MLGARLSRMQDAGLVAKLCTPQSGTFFLQLNQMACVAEQEKAQRFDVVLRRWPPPINFDQNTQVFNRPSALEDSVL